MIKVGDRGEFRMWNSGDSVTGTVTSIWLSGTGGTRVLFTRDGYRETYNIDADHFREWFSPFVAVRRPGTYQEIAK